MIPAFAMALRNPRLDMTVATTVSPASTPRALRSRARTARIWSPSIISPVASTARQRSASPSCAIPASAPCLVTAADRASRCVEPQSALMFSPSGSAPIAITSAPARRSSSGASAEAAPCAQSTTTRSPASVAVPCVAADATCAALSSLVPGWEASR